MRYLFLLLLIASQVAHADVQVQSQFYFPVSPADYKQVLQKMDPLKDLHGFEIDNIHLTQPYKTDMKGIRLDFVGQSRLNAQDSVGQFSFEVDFESLHLNIDQIKTSDVIRQNVGGVSIIAYLNGLCKDVDLKTLGSTLKLSGDFQVQTQDSQIQLTLKSFDLKGDAQWSFQASGCDAPKGFEKILKKEVVKTLNDHQFLKKSLQQSLKDLFVKMSKDVQNKVLQPVESQLYEQARLKIQPLGVDLDESTGWLMIRGDVKTTIPSEKTETQVVEAPDLSADPLHLQQSGLMISQEFMKKSLNLLQAQGQLKYKFLGQDISGLKSLLSNRLFQWFLWGDLLNFATQTPFEFLAKSVEPLQMAQVAADPKGFLWYRVQNKIEVDMSAPRDQILWPYMRFESNVDTHAWMSVQKGRLIVGFHAPKMDLKASWFAAYYQRYKPSRSINTGFFAKQIRSSLQGYQHQIKLPNMNIGDLSLQASRLQGQGPWLQLVYTP